MKTNTLKLTSVGRILKTILITLCFFLVHSNLFSQTPTMQVAANIGDIEFTNLVLSTNYGGWHWGIQLGGQNGNINAKDQFTDWGGIVTTLQPITMPVLSDGSNYPAYAPIPRSDGKSIYPTLLVSLTKNGTYTFIVNGHGTLNFFGDPHYYNTAGFMTSYGNNPVSFANGTTLTFTVTGLTDPISTGYPSTTGSTSMGNTQLGINIAYSDASNPVKNIRVLPPDFTDPKGVVHHYATSYTTEPFQAKFLQDIQQKYSCFRFMDMCRTNMSPVKYWQETGQCGGIVASGQSQSYLSMIQLGNAANRDIWVNIPHLATDGFADTLATLIKNNLNTGLKAYIEYSNEVWNTSFGQSGWANQQGIAMGYTDPTTKFYAHRSGQIFKRITNIFNTDRNRVILVCAWQMGSGNNNLGSYYNDPIINPDGVKPDVFAVAPYFGKVYLTTDIGVVGSCDYQTCAACNATTVPSVQTIENDLIASIKTFVGPVLRQAKVGAVKYNIPLINYEGGYGSQGMYGAENSCALTDNECQVNRSSQMYTIQRLWMDTVKVTGVQMINQFVDCAGWSKWGWWGMEEYRGQDSASVKLRALVDWEHSNPVILDKQAPSQPGAPVKMNATASAISISWAPSTDNGIIIGYDVFVNGIIAGSSNCQTVNTQYTINGLAANTSYSITIKARDFGGNYSPPSNTLVVSTGTIDTQKPTVVIGLQCSGKSSNSISLKWSASSDNDKVTQYLIYWGNKVDSTLNVQYSINGLTAGTEYKCIVKAQDPSGNLSDPSYLDISTDLLPVVIGKQTFASVNVDGNLDEADWKLSYSFNRPVSVTDVPDNDSHNFSILWDANYLYIGAKAIDNVLYKNGSFYNGDGFEFEIDGNHNHSTTLEAGHDVKYTIQWNNNAINGADTIGVLHKFQNITGGWSCEIAIPWSKLGITAPTAGTSVGFDIIYDDNDGISWGRSRQVAFTGDQSIWSSCAQFGDLIFATDNTPPTVPANVAASNITLGSAAITWSPSTDNSGIKGYNVYVNNTCVNTDLISGTSFIVTGLTPTTLYSISVIAKDNNDNSSIAGNCQFTTLTGNTLINFKATDNTTASYGVKRPVVKNSTFDIISFSTATGSELFNVSGFNNQFQIKGGYRYDCSPNAPTNHSTPILVPLPYNGQSGDGTLYVYTGETFASNATGIYMWTKDKFMNGNSTFPNLVFDNTSNSKLILNADLTYGNARFIVKAGNTYYISEFNCQSSKGTFQVSAFGNNSNINLRWAEYDPSTLMMPAANSLNFKAVNLTDVQEVGVIFSVGRAAWAYNFSLIQFSVYGVQSTADIQVPTSPSNLTASNVVSNSFTLNWAASTDNVGVTSYEVFKNSISVGTTTATSLSLSGLSENTTYAMTVKAKDAAGNSSTESPVLSVKTSLIISGLEENRNIIDIYPNPANNWINIETNSDNQILTITDLQGKVILTRSMSGSKNRINLSSLKQGIYILEVRSDRYIQYKKLIVK